MNFLSIDSKFMAFLTRIADLMILNIIYVLCCLPVFTIGAATTALYTVTFRIGTERESGVVKPFFRAFCSNFKQGTILWLLLLSVSAVLVLNLVLTSHMESMARYLFFFFACLLTVVLFTGAYLFPMLSQFENSTRQTLHNAALLSVGYFPRTILITALNILPVALFLYMPILFLGLWFLWFCFYSSGAAYLNAKLFRKIFAPYMPNDRDDEPEKV